MAHATYFPSRPQGQAHSRQWSPGLAPRAKARRTGFSGSTARPFLFEPLIGYLHDLTGRLMQRATGLDRDDDHIWHD